MQSYHYTTGYIESQNIQAQKCICICPDASWSSASQGLFPLFEDLAKHYSDTEDVVVARIDVTANDVNIQMTDRYPTIKLFPAVYAERVRNAHLLVNIERTYSICI